MSNVRLDKVIVFDLEATCWATEDERRLTPSEIIEIGACLLDVRTGEISKKTRYIIRPKVLEVSQYCTDLTGHTIESLKKGIPFTDACNKFKKEFGTTNKICAAYGGDRARVDTECQRFGVLNPLSTEYLNISHLFALKYKNSKVSLEQALKKIGEEFEGIPHHGDDDAYNAAKVLRNILS
jgi:inhibitor of KinA sporulation pathway (predicted exonuclease)